MTVESHAPASCLREPVVNLSGVGPERGAQLARLEITSVEDLLLHRPRRYEERNRLVKIAELQLHVPAITHGKIVAMGTKWFRQHSKSIFEIILDDGTGRLHCRWWNLPYMEKYFAVGDEVLAFGKPLGLKPRTIDHPETEVLEGGEEEFIHLNRVTPIYPLREGLSQRWLRALIWRTLQRADADIHDPWPSDLHTSASLPSRAQAIRNVHFPERLEDVFPARQRLALDEFVELQRQIQTRRKNFERRARGLPCAGDNRLMKPFLKQLGFELTPGQMEVLRVLRNDMSGVHPMRRLLQGEVGCGKTLVAACCALMALESGFSVALMAPTEILAEQHFSNFTKWFRPLGVRIELRTGSYKPSTPLALAHDATSDLLAGNTPGQAVPLLTVGTHALIESGFRPENLGLVIIDEQHKFGVTQREELLRKGVYPHLLVMTATPIPRTLGLTLYGELDVSVIQGLPPGRGQIKTFVRGTDRLPKVWKFVHQKLSEGRQAYVVHPHIEQSSQNGIKGVTSEFGTIQKLLHPFLVGLLHGRLSAQEKEKVMNSFRKGDTKVLLATLVIEVGVDVANATIMVIENAEQFGLAQLHQLRGRIGRGSHDSFCVLVTEARNKAAQGRLRVLEKTSDGFQIAEEDLRLRGPGELLGQQQSGVPKFRFGDLTTDLHLVRQAREIANRLLDASS